MKKFKIEIQELLSRTIEIEAKNIKEATKKANQLYKAEEIVLDYSDLSQTEIIPQKIINEKEILTKEIIEYLYNEEKKHFEESEKPKSHIFLKLERLKAIIE